MLVTLMCGFHIIVYPVLKQNVIDDEKGILSNEIECKTSKVSLPKGQFSSKEYDTVY